MKRFIAVVPIALTVIVLVFGPAATVFFFHRQAMAECEDRQRAYDGRVFIVRFIGKELHAPQARIDEALVHLHNETGPRPTC